MSVAATMDVGDHFDGFRRSGDQKIKEKTRKTARAKTRTTTRTTTRIGGSDKG